MAKISYFCCYSVEEVAHILKRSKHTILQHIKDGLRTIDKKRPYLIRGDAIEEYMNVRNGKRKHKVLYNQMLCMKCKEISAPYENKVVLHDGIGILAKGICPHCKNIMTKLYKKADIERLQNTFEIVKDLSVNEPFDTSSIIHLNEFYKNYENNVKKGVKNDTIFK